MPEFPVKSIGVVGGGTVGHATARAFMEHAEVRVYDVVPERRTHDLEATLRCDLVFVCLPTPQKGDTTECDTSFLHRFFAAAAGTGIDQSRVNYVLRSTVPVGTTRLLARTYGLRNLVHSPEFLTARCAVTDAQLPARNVVGLPEPRRVDAEVIPLPEGQGQAVVNRPTQICYRILHRVYEARFPGVSTLTMSSDESELVKLGLNSFFAVKVSFFNELRAFADRAGLNWDSVRAGILSDGRVAHSHTQVPGPDGSYGYGGACLVKDASNLVDCMERGGSSAPLVRASLERNKIDRQRRA